MATIRQLLQVPLDGTMDQKTSARYLAPGNQVTTVQNGVWVKTGTVEKRRGFVGLTKTTSTGTNLAKGQRLFSLRNELLMSDGTGVYSWSPSANEWIWRDHAPVCVATRKSIEQGPVNYTDQDIADCGNYRCIVWDSNPLAGSGADIFVSLIDMTTGAYVYSSLQLTSGAIYSHPKVIAVGTRIIVLYDDAASGTHIISKWIDITNLSAGWSATQNLVLTLGGNILTTAWDATPVAGSNANDFVIAWGTASGGTRVQLQRFAYSGSGTFTSQATNALPETLSPSALSVRVTSGENGWVAFNSFNSGTNTNSVKFAVFNASTLGVTLSATIISNYTASSNLFLWSGIERVDSTHSLIMWANSYSQGNTTNQGTYWCVYSSAGTPRSSIRSNPAVIPLSKPFAVNGRVYMLGLVGAKGLTNVSPQSTTVLVDMHADDTTATMQLREVARCSPRFSGPQSRFPSSLANINTPGVSTNTKYVTVCPVGLNSSVRYGNAQITLDFAHPGLCQAAELGGTTYLAGGVPCLYDGTEVSEIGFAYYPDSSLITATPSIAGGGMAAGTYGYVFVYEWWNSHGERQQSAPSLSVGATIASGTTGSITLSGIPTLTLTSKQEGDTATAQAVAIVPYRTEANGSVFYRCISDNVPSAFLNSITAASIANWTDTAQTNATSPLLYTTGNVVENDCPSSFAAIASHKGRIWGVGDDLRTLWFSTQYVPGSPVRFTDTFQLTMPEDITALASMDDKLIAFAPKRIYVIVGEGPPETGAGSDFLVSPPIPGDVGCVDPRSVVLTPAGLAFQGVQGLYLLDRSLQVQWIGRNMVDLTTTYPVCTSAVLVPEQNQVRWTFTTADATDGTHIVWDYVLGKWAFWNVLDSDTSTNVFASACEVNGVYYVLGTGGLVSQERQTGDSKLYLDGAAGASGTWVPLYVETGEVHLAGLQGFKRVRRVNILAESMTPHGMTVGVANDFAASPTQVASWTNGDISLLSWEQLSIRLANPRVSSIRVSLQDVPPLGGGINYGTGQGPRLDGLLVEWVPKVGPARLAAGARK